MGLLSALAGGLGAMVAARARAIETEMMRTKALDPSDFAHRLHQIEELKAQPFSMFS